MTPSKPHHAVLPLALSTGAVLMATAWVYRHLFLRRRRSPSHDQTSTMAPEADNSSSSQREAANDSPIQRGEIIITNDDDDHRGGRRLLAPGTVTIAYASTTGTCASFARRLHDVLSSVVRKEEASSSSSLTESLSLFQESPSNSSLVNPELSV
ncbi:hypothetical protein ACHAWX_006837 [Stephanocyclus meneghinianus]